MLFFKNINITENNKLKIYKFVSWFLIISSILCGLATYVAMTPSGDSNKYLVLTLLNIDLVLIVTLVIIVTRSLIKLRSRKKHRQLGSQLHTRIVAFFSFLAAVPAIIVAIFGAIFFTVGIENWFSSRVESALNKSESVANAYLLQGQEQIGLEARDIANIISTSNLIYNDPFSLERLVNHLAYERKLTEVIILDNSERIIAKNGLAFLFESPIRNEMLKVSFDSRELVINFSELESEKLTSAILPLDPLAKHFLFISRFKNLNVVKDINDVKKAVYEYRGVETKREGLHVTFTMIFIVVAILLMLAAIFIGLNFANGIVTPISNLANAAERVSSGDLKVRVPNLSKNDEISDLSKIFNKMTEQLGNQRNDLLNVNTQLESRRRFTETVLSGVTAGVIGIDEEEKVFLPNRSAIELLNIDIKTDIGKNFGEVIPEMKHLLNEAKNNPDVITKGQVDIKRKNNKVSLMTQVSVEKSKNKIFGYVITFDDMTELLQAQRIAAWSDVARRIAHEIKNPLTPIQLAAERLKKKYSSLIKKEPAIFDSCINTIVRQVDDMRTMVNEFSSFARMPSPILKKTNLTDLINGLGSVSILSRNDIKVDIEVPSKNLYAMMDGNQIRQVMLNLISNAINSIDDFSKQKKQGSFKKHLKIRLSLKKGLIVISVADNGLGLPEKNLDELMQPYVTTRQEGTGLGLAIVKKIMEDHKGNLKIENIGKNKGVIASVSFPKNLK